MYRLPDGPTGSAYLVSIHSYQALTRDFFPKFAKAGSRAIAVRDQQSRIRTHQRSQLAQCIVRKLQLTLHRQLPTGSGEGIASQNYNYALRPVHSCAEFEFVTLVKLNARH